MRFPFSIIIPARHASKRLPGKLLLDIEGKPLIQHVHETAKATKAVKIYVATDDTRIRDVAESFDANVVMTSSEHESGTERLAEVVSTLNLPDDEIIVNVQADEYGLPAVLIEQVAQALYDHTEVQVATLCESMVSVDDYMNPNIVKVVFDYKNIAIYFSRAPIPLDRNGHMPEKVYRHIGLYAYKAAYLKKITRLDACLLEKAEALEQLRILYYGDKIHVAIALVEAGVGIDTHEDLERVRSGT